MEKQHFDDFIKIFRHLENAALIISEEFYKPRVKQEIDEKERNLKNSFILKFLASKWESERQKIFLTLLQFISKQRMIIMKL